MKDKDPNEDEFNQDEQDNINEADDSFGLPDLDFNTLEEGTEEEGSSVEPTEPEEINEVEDNADAASDTNDTTASDTESGYDSEEDSDHDDSDEDETPMRRTYIPPKPESNAPKIIIALVVTIIVSLGVWYFIYYRPHADAAEKAKIEAQRVTDNAAKIAAAEKAKQAAERLAAEAAALQAAEEESLKAQATFSTITEPTGRYYIVIESFVDSDLAADLGKDLVIKGYSSVLLSPKGKKKYHRLTMGDYASFFEGQEAANKLKAEFGDDLWVLKY